MATYVYLIHFAAPLAHARHYIGATSRLRTRLQQHATGDGARILAVLAQRRIAWELARLFVCDDEPWSYETYLKIQKNAPAFCPICSPDRQRTLDGFVEYPLTSIPFPIDSDNLRKVAPCMKSLTDTQSNTEKTELLI